MSEIASLKGMLFELHCINFLQDDISFHWNEQLESVFSEINKFQSIHEN